jgi:K+-sensing histidine kinase KdpD
MADDELRSLVHDLRTPLTLIAGFADLLVRRGAELDEPQRAELVERIAAAAREMRERVDRADAAR